MKKYIPYVLITMLLMVIASGITYIVMTDKEDNNKTNENNENNNNNNEVVKEDGVELISIKEENDKIIEEFKVTLNGKEQTLKVEYEYADQNYYEYFFPSVSGKFKDNYLFSMEYLNINNQSYSKENTFNIANIKNTFNEENFSIIKGTDNKNYLLVQTMYDGMDVFNTSELYIYNDNLELISKDLITGAESPDYATHNGFVIYNFAGNIPCDDNLPAYVKTFKTVSNIDGNQQYVKIENNQIYFLFPKINEDLDGGIIEERVYTISNDKLSYKVINTYQFNSVCQQI